MSRVCPARVADPLVVTARVTRRTAGSKAPDRRRRIVAWPGTPDGGIHERHLAPALRRRSQHLSPACPLAGRGARRGDAGAARGGCALLPPPVPFDPVPERAARVRRG